ncbi:MAG: HAD-IA family hydrolase [Terriglobia bacterium]|jgi:phosphoglycolate phosphatase
MTIERRTLPGIQLVVFDLDGTLADTKRDLALSVNAMRESMGLGPLPLEAVTSYIGHGVTVLIKRALGDQAAEGDVQKGLGFFLDHYARHLLDNTVAYPGVAEALEELRNRKLAILTNKPTEFSREIVAGLGFARYFFEIYGGDSFSLKKPDPVGIKTLMSNSSTPARHTLMVGDSDTDVQTGRNAGVWTCGVTYGFAPETVRKASPDLLLDDLRDLPRALGTGESPVGSKQ